MFDAARVVRVLLPLLGTAGTAALAVPGAYDLDGGASQVDASVSFFAIGTRTAHFPAVSGEVSLDRTNASHILLDVVLDARRLTASDSLTESRLRGPGFFDVEHFPMVRFHGERLILTDAVSGRVDGTLTARGVTRPESLAVHFSQPPGAANGTPMTLSATMRINRNDFGMRAYPLIVGSRVTVTINARLMPRD